MNESIESTSGQTGSEQTSPTATQPLAGLLVVSLEQAVAAPFCTSRLADAGARVIKVERAAGDFARDYDGVVNGLSTYFVWTNRGKESLVLDIKNPDDAALLHRIINQADIFIQNLAPGASARSGFASDNLRQDNPRLITVDISGYGEVGPYRDMKAYDLLVQGETGLASVTGSQAEPGRVGVSICDISCGMYAHSAILEALIARAVTGEGQGIKLSLFDSLADWMNVPLLHHTYGGKAPERIGIGHPGIAPYGAYAAADGEWIILSIQNDREWQSFCQNVLKQPAIAADPMYSDNTERCANRTALDELINAVFSQLDRQMLVDRLRSASIAFGRLNSVADLALHPQLRQVRFMTERGMVEMAAPPAISSAGVREIRKVPALGSASAAIRNEFAED